MKDLPMLADDIYTIPKNKARIVTRGDFNGIGLDKHFPLTKEVPLEDITKYSINPVTYGLEKRTFNTSIPQPRQIEVDSKVASLYFKEWYSNSLKRPLSTSKDMTNQQWDNLYNTAIKSGNLSEVQKLRDLHFKTKANTDMIDSQGNPIHEYHGSPEENLTELLSPSDPRMPKSINTNFKATGQEGIYLSPVKSYAARYTADLGGRYRTKLTKEQRELIKSGKSREEIGLPSPPKGRVYDFYSNTRQVPLNSNLTFNPMTLTSADRQAIEKAGYSGFTLPSSKMPEHVVFKSNQLKLSDPITYDDSGNIIPLSKRDNFNNPDIRYGLIPFLGFGAYSQYSKNK